MEKTRIWDIPVRLFHWTLLVLVSVSLYTGLTGGFDEMEYHMLSGYAILSLVLFRLVWCFIGTTYARFATFIKGPGTIVEHIKSLPTQEGESAGHNPLGALGIIALLLSLLVQAGTGLFANDDIFTEGPLVHLVSYDTSRSLTAIHEWNYYVLATLIGLHLVAIAFYELYLRERLILPMITGYKRIKAHSVEFSWTRELAVGVIAMGICAALVYGAIEYL